MTSLFVFFVFFFYLEDHRRSHSLRSDTWNGSFGPKECQISAKLSGATMGSMSLHHGTSKPSTTRVWMERAGAQSCTARCLAWLPWPDVTQRSSGEGRRRYQKLHAGTAGAGRGCTAATAGAAESCAAAKEVGGAMGCTPSFKEAQGGGWAGAQPRDVRPQGDR